MHSPLCMPRKRRPTSPPPAVDKILADRRARNARVWQRFNAQGLQDAWDFLFDEECRCPSLDLEPQVFRERLGMRTTEHPSKTDLEIAVRRKMAGELVEIRWRGPHISK
jgi:hypothetical protein